MKITGTAVFAIIIASLCFSSCNETLPPYEEPRDVLSAHLSFQSNDTLLVYYQKKTKTYFMDDQMIFNLSVTNMIDNLLQGQARVVGSIQVQSFCDIPRVLDVELTEGELRTPPVFQGNIALGPNASAVLATLWVPFALDGHFVTDGLPSTSIGTDIIIGPILFQAQAKMQIFDRVQPVQSEQILFKKYFRVREM